MKRFLIRMMRVGLLLSLGVYSGSLAQSQELQLLAHLNEYPSSGYSDCWGYTAPDGHEYALLGVDAGVSIVDITDTSNIAEVDFVPFVNYSWYDIKTYQNYMYVTSEGGTNLLVVDLSPLPDPASIVGQFPMFSSGPHNNFIDTETGILYGVEDQHYDPSVRIIDIVSPGNPTELSTINTANNGQDSHDVFAQDSVLYIAEGFSPSIGFFDVSNPANPSLIQRLTIPAAGYVHQVWVTKDNKYMITTEETSGKTVKMWDIQDLNNISPLGTYLGGSQLAHNAYLKGDYAYISHYESGLKVVDISDPNNLVEVGYYDTYLQGETPNFHGAWGTYPFFSSGKILISDIESGLYVVYFKGAADADSLDPNPPENLAAYSDYTTPNSMLLTWNDPTTYFGGNPLSPSEFTIEIERNETQVASVPGGTGTYIDNGLVDGQLYEYKIYAKIMATDSTSLAASTSWTAGGSPVSASPDNLTLTNAGGGMLKAKWVNPSKNDDGTLLDDFTAINLYENGSLITTLTRSFSDTGKADSTVFTPGGVNLPYYVTAVDNETPPNESVPSNIAYPPFSAPYLEDFESATPGTPGTLPVQWTNETDDDIDWYVNEGGTPSSGTGPLVDHTEGTALGNYMYTEATSPNFPNKVAHLTTPFVDLSIVTNPVLIFWYHMYGVAMGELHVDVFANGIWNLDVMPPLIGQQQLNQTDPWEQVVVDLSSFTSGPVQVRFRGITGSDYTSDMAIDDALFGSTSANPQMTVTPNTIVDTLMIGEMNSHQVTVSNLQPSPSTLNYTATESPSVSWLAVSPTSGSVTSNQSEQVSVALDAAGLTSGSYSTNILISGNDPANPQETVTVNLEVVEAPVISISSDSIHFSLEQNQSDSLPLVIYNTGGVPLEILSIEDEEVNSRSNRVPAYLQQQKPTVFEQKGTNHSNSGEVLAGSGGPDPFGYTWIDSDEPDGPSYSFTDISGTGTVVNLQPTGTYDPKDEGQATVNLPFDVNFYGNSYNQLQVNSNGFITFDMSFFDNAFTNQGIPNSSTPNLYAAPFWDDLDGSAGGNIYYEQIGNKFIIQWHNWGHYPSGTQNLIFQVVLFQNSSTIWFVYENIVDQGDATFGIENSDGTIGLEVAYNFPYAHNQLLTKIGLGADWLTEEPNSGTIAPGDSLEVTIIADASNLQDGVYRANLVINSNDPVNGTFKSPTVTLEVGNVTDIGDPTGLPRTFVLKPNYPNPFNPTTTIFYQVPHQSDVRIEIYNMLGQKVRTLLNDRKEAGKYSAIWDGRNDSGAQVGSGVYLYRMIAGDFVQVRKMILMK